MWAMYMDPLPYRSPSRSVHCDVLGVKDGGIGMTLLMSALVLCGDAVASGVVAAALCMAQLAPDVLPAQPHRYTTAADSAKGIDACLVQF